jgi:cytidine deaminase
MNTESELIDAANAARRFASASYSGITVGAALETTDGQILCGSNIENASYNLGMCAERVAMFKALSEGHRQFKRIAIVAEGSLCTPCGACRQILWEFGGDMEIVVRDLKGRASHYRLSELLPAPFDRDSF